MTQDTPSPRPAKQADELTGLRIDSVDPRGYVRLRAKDHPIAAPSGTLGRHRAIAFDTWGPGEQRCYWCGYRLPWQSEDPRRAVHVDHLNAVPGDDRPENLAPACIWCNTNRSWGEWLFEKWRRVHGSPSWADVLDLVASTPPWERPNGYAVANQLIGASAENVNAARDEWAAESPGVRAAFCKQFHSSYSATRRPRPNVERLGADLASALRGRHSSADALRILAVAICELTGGT